VVLSGPRLGGAVARAFLDRLEIFVEQEMREYERLDLVAGSVGDTLQNPKRDRFLSRFHSRVDRLADAQKLCHFFLTEMPEGPEALAGGGRWARGRKGATVTAQARPLVASCGKASTGLQAYLGQR